MSSQPPRVSSQVEFPSDSWQAYFAALTLADQKWTYDYGGKFGVFSGKNSHLKTIRAARPLFKNDWALLSIDEARILLGLVDNDGNDYGHLGSMQPAGTAKNVFLKQTPRNLRIRQSVQGAVNSLLAVPLTDLLPTMARRSCEIIMNHDGLGIGVATRLLALARPEVLVSVNHESAKGLAEWAKMSAAAIATPSGYEKFVRWVMKGRWWNGPAPAEPFEHEVWSCRAALMDGLIYEGQHFRDNL